MAGFRILAVVLLKLGGYGVYSFTWPLLSDATAFNNDFESSLIPCRQVDLKHIITYSSVAHVRLVMLLIFSHAVQSLF